jgi:hypothetical protein
MVFSQVHILSNVGSFDNQLMNGKGHGRKWLWRILRICPEGLREDTKSLRIGENI